MTQTGSETFGGLIFQLQDLPNVTSLTGLFDQYKIEKVSVEFMPCANAIPPNFISAANLTTGSANIRMAGRLLAAPDLDDALAWSSFNQGRQYNTAQEVEAYKTIKFTFKPRLAVGAFQGGVSTAYANQSSWMDCAYPGVPHYGAKWALSRYLGAQGALSYDVKTTMYIAMRNVI